MADWPITQPGALPLHIHTQTRWSVGQALRTLGVQTSAVTATTWVNGLAAYFPVVLPFAYPVNRVFWYNGSTITSTSADFGIYSVDGARLWSLGSTAMSGASAHQYATPSTPFLLPAGAYYFAWACNNTTNRAACSAGPSANAGRLIGLLEQTSAFPLPATMSPVAWTRAFGPPYCGITRTTTGF
jgi:hypothetical protein